MELGRRQWIVRSLGSAEVTLEVDCVRSRWIGRVGRGGEGSGTPTVEEPVEEEEPARKTEEERPGREEELGPYLQEEGLGISVKRC